MSATPLPPRTTRRWPRYQIDLPVRITALNGILTAPVMARGSDISRAGMALHAKISLNPGDLMQLQFPTAEPSRVNAIVRHRSGDRLGLEFLSQLPPDNEAQIQLKSLAPASGRSSTSTATMTAAYTPKALDEGLRRKQEELRQLQREIEVLSIAILLLAEEEKKFVHSRSLIAGNSTASPGRCRRNSVLSSKLPFSGRDPSTAHDDSLCSPSCFAQDDTA